MLNPSITARIRISQQLWQEFWIDEDFDAAGDAWLSFDESGMFERQHHLMNCPKHASWLNMVEIEIGVLRTQCLDRRIDSKERLVSEIAAWEQQRNASRARIKWMFTTEKARDKMGRAYPKLAAKES
jgi:hypothetical protein